MKHSDPFISIIIPTYNRADLITNTLKSIIAQTFLNYEVIIVDDGGTDHTGAVVKSLQNERIHYFWKENGERGAARNFGISRASGRYITFIDSDDILYPDHLETAHYFLESHKNIYCYAQAYEVRNVYNNELIAHGYISPDEMINDQIIKGNFLSCFGVFVKREVLADFKFEEDRLFAGTEDWLLWLQLAARYPFYYNNRITGAMLEHNNRSVLSFKESSLRYRCEFIREKLMGDQVFIKKYGTYRVDKIYAHMLSYSSLHLAMSKRRKEALQYFLRAISISNGELFTRRSLAIAKTLLLP